MVKLRTLAFGVIGIYLIVAVANRVAEAAGMRRCDCGRAWSWTEIGRTLGVPEAAEDKDALIRAFAASRQAILDHQLRNVT